MGYMNGFLTVNELKELTGYTHRKLQTRWLTYNRIPFFLTRDGKSGDSKVIVSWSSINNHKNPEESEAIDEIIRLKSKGNSLRDIANILNSAGVKPRRSSKWSHSSVAHIISTKT